jgi:AP-4 complex subunit epsilon-1
MQLNFAFGTMRQDPDDTLKHKMLDLLYKMTKSSNVEVIVENMITYMQTLNDAHNKIEIAGRVIELAEQFAPSNQWFTQMWMGALWHGSDYEPGV